MTPWTWIWANSRRWWGTGEPGVLQSMRSQRVEHNLAIGREQWSQQGWSASLWRCCFQWTQPPGWRASSCCMFSSPRAALWEGCSCVCFPGPGKLLTAGVDALIEQVHRSVHQTWRACQSGFWTVTACFPKGSRSQVKGSRPKEPKRCGKFSYWIFMAPLVHSTNPDAWGWRHNRSAVKPAKFYKWIGLLASKMGASATVRIPNFSYPH